MEDRGGEDEFIGRGVLLHTMDGGRLWEIVGGTNFDAGEGTFSCFFEKWKEVGPMSSIVVKKVPQPDGEIVTKGWIASRDGVYFATNASDSIGAWRRITPRPDEPDCYSSFMGIHSGLDLDREIYAFGWQGIAHWATGGKWEIQLKTHQFYISQVRAYGVNYRDAWAVSQGTGDAGLRSRDQDHGALFHLDWPGTNWVQTPLTGIDFSPLQGLTDIIKLRNSETLLIVGQHGMIIRGSMEGATRVWKTVPSHTKQDLLSITYDANLNLWIAGDFGIILQSHDDGETWTDVASHDEHGSGITDHLNRVVFCDNNQGWIVGNNIVLKYEPPRDNH